MKNIFIVPVMAIIAFTACNSNTNKSAEDPAVSKDTAQNRMPSDSIAAVTPAVADVPGAVNIKGIVTAYLQLKNAFTVDNTNGAATAGAALEAAFKAFDKSTLTGARKKTFEEVQDDAREHAEHIGKNGGNIKHQREHFDMLSKDMADLIKSFGTGGQTLYKDFCPMYNEGKGAFWISETKDIKNPYLGREMPTCGEVKEELK